MGQRNENWPVIGMDLGTTYSCVGVWQNDRAEIIPNDQGNRTTPSRVAFTDTQRLIGEAAENQGRINPTNTIFDIKRLIGRRFNDEIVQKNMTFWPFKVIAGPAFGDDNKPVVVVSFKGEEKQFSAEEISAMILMKMKETAEAHLGMPVKNAVVTVPAYFNDSQRQATKEAGDIAGLTVLRIINEPTAAAMAYGLDRQSSSKRNVLVFDLGGGTFDVSLVCIEGDIFEVLAVGGDAHLGGSDFNNRMVSHFVEEFKTKHDKDVSQIPKALGRIREACERAKRTLSATTETSIDLDCLTDGIDYSLTVSRARFDNLNIDLFRKCIDIVQECLSDANIQKSDVDEVLLVGGSTRILKVQELLREFFDGRELNRSINQDEAVAQGATIQAGKMCGATATNSMVLVDVTPLSLGVELGPGNMSVIIPKNTTIPTRHERLYGASHVKKDMCEATDGHQTSVLAIPVYEGERQRAKDNNFLGVFELSGSFQSNGSSSMINVCFEVDINGILNVSAEDTSSGNRSEITITNRSRLTRAEMDRLMAEAEKYQAQDKEYERMVKAKNDLENYANGKLEMLLSRRGHTIEASAKIRITNASQQALEWIRRNSENVLEAAVYVEKLGELESICNLLSS